MNSMEIIDYASLDNNALAIKGVSADLLSQSSEIEASLNSVDARVLGRLDNSYSPEVINESSARLDITADFLNEVSTTYKLTDEDLKKELTWEHLVAIYPYFAELSDERKAIMIAAFKYLNMGSSQVFSYARAFSNEYGKQVNPTQTWCANFVGSIISYFWGSGNVIPSSYASVWKIIGLYNGNLGVAFNDDPRYKFVLGEAYSTKAQMGGLTGWDSSIANFNKKYGKNKSLGDWIDDDFLPQSGDLIVFNGDTKMSAEQFYNSSVSTAYPGSSGAYSHIGFVLGVREVNGQLFIDTIEGNVNDDVQVRSFRADDPYIYGYGHINYEEFDSTLDVNSMNYELQKGIDTSQSGAVLGSVTSKLQAFDLNGTNAVRVGDFTTDPSNDDASLLIDKDTTVDKPDTGTFTSDTPPKGTTVRTGNRRYTPSFTDTYTEPTNPIDTVYTPSTNPKITDVLPESTYSNSIPEVSFGTLSTFKEDETNAIYIIKDYSIDDYSSYIELLQEKGFLFTNDMQFSDGKTLLSLDFNSDSELVLRVQPIDTTVQV